MVVCWLLCVRVTTGVGVFFARSLSRSSSRSSSPEVVQSKVEYITEFGAASDDEGESAV